MFVSLFPFLSLSFSSLLNSSLFHFCLHSQGSLVSLFLCLIAPFLNASDSLSLSFSVSSSLLRWVFRVRFFLSRGWVYMGFWFLVFWRDWVLKLSFFFCILSGSVWLNFLRLSLNLPCFPALALSGSGVSFCDFF